MITNGVGSWLYYLISAILVILVLLGIHLLSKIKTAKLGNLISAISLFLAVVLTVLEYEIFGIWELFLFIGIGTLLGVLIAYRVKMIKMPQLVAILNGLGGLASLIVGIFALFQVAGDSLLNETYFSIFSAVLAIIIGSITFSGSTIAYLKLDGKISSKPHKPKGYLYIVIVFFILMLGLAISAYFIKIPLLVTVLSLVLALLFGILFTIAIGGADMPIAISLLNSFSGLAAAISGLAINELLLVAFGGIVGVSGLILTEIMCKAMNKTVFDVLLGKTTIKGDTITTTQNLDDLISDDSLSIEEVLNISNNIIVVPGYGMAVAQAQSLVKDLSNRFKEEGKDVKYAIHPVAGRMPGHMNVLLAEVGVDYDDLYDLEHINDQFKNSDLVIVVGANDVINPAAKSEVDTPIYGMPVLNVEEAKHIFIFNYDLKPGYSGVENELYKRKKGIYFFLGDAKETLKDFINKH